MNFVIFGLTISSSWGNGHATLWRGLVRSLTALGHAVVFFERDVEYYRSNRDLWELGDGAELLLYPDWGTIAARAARELRQADVAIVTSYCPDAVMASDLLLDSPASTKVFYDLDTPVTLARLQAGERVEYLPSGGLGAFDLVLSYTGGEALEKLRTELGARRAAPLYGHVDPRWHKPAAREEYYCADLAYLGTYAADRQQDVEKLLFAPARARPDSSFIVGGSAYPDGIAWPANVRLVNHVPPSHHPSFYSSSRLQLNVTRVDMAQMGWCPSGRLFEAAACGAAIVSDWWEGLDSFFTLGDELLIVRTAEDVMAALDRPAEEHRAIGQRARERVLNEHTSMHRAQELVGLVESAPTQLPQLAEA